MSAAHVSALRPDGSVDQVSRPRDLRLDQKVSDEMERSVIEKLATKTVLVVGDLMIDRFVYGDVDRISPEAPIPVLRFREGLDARRGRQRRA